MEIKFWLNIPSMILAPSIKILSEDKTLDITCIFIATLPKSRINLGWNVPDYGDVKLVYLTEDEYLNQINRIVSHSADDSIHVISGIGGYRKIRDVLNELVNKKYKIICLSEAGAGYGIRKYFALIKNYYLVRRYDKYINKYIVFGTLGQDYFKQLGVSLKKMYTFSYQAPIIYEKYRSYIKKNNEPKKSQLRILFVGQIIHRKGLDLLLDSIKNFKKEKIRLTIAGDGILKNKLKSKTLKPFCNHKIRWLGSVASHKLPKLYCMSDVLIVPSRYDGWAAVTNEALTLGTPVIISDACGAKDIIISTGAGVVFKNRSVVELSNVLSNIFHDNKYFKLLNENAANCYQKINSRSIGTYLKNILLYDDLSPDRPCPPWECNH